MPRLSTRLLRCGPRRRPLSSVGDRRPPPSSDFRPSATLGKLATVSVRPTIKALPRVSPSETSTTALGRFAAALPASWEKIAGVHSGGVFWLRKEVTLPAEAAGKPFALVLNYMHQQYDTTYFNGVEIGRSGDKPPMFSLSERRYEVPGELVQAGKNVIAVRVVAADPRSDLMGRGFRGDYNLPIDQHLVGNQWRWHVESLLPPLSAEALKNRPRPNEPRAAKHSHDSL